MNGTNFAKYLIEMVYSVVLRKVFGIGACLALAVGLTLPFLAFFKSLLGLWTSNEQFSYGMAMPLVALYLVWTRRSMIPNDRGPAWLPGLAMTLIGCALQLVATLGGALLFSGVAFALTLAGTVGFCLGREYLRASAASIALLILMVPPPGYLVDEITWHMQVLASTISAGVFDLLRVPVYHDGNLLRLSGYVLEVKQACSGSRSVFALMALAFIIGLRTRPSWLVRSGLIVSAVILAICANVFRIIGAGLIAERWGSLVANESLHTAWGVFVFIVAIVGLLGVHKFLRWISAAYAS